MSPQSNSSNFLDKDEQSTSQYWAEHLCLQGKRHCSYKNKEHTTFDFLQKRFIKQFSCLQLQPVEKEKQKNMRYIHKLSTAADKVL